MKLAQEVTKEILCLNDMVCEHQQKLYDVEKAQEDFVLGYMTDHDMWDNKENIMEIIGYLPPGYLRFKLIDRCCEINEMERILNMNGPRL